MRLFRGFPTAWGIAFLRSYARLHLCSTDGRTCQMIALTCETRTCRHCGEEKAISAFTKSKRSLGGHAHSCRACTNIQQRARYDPIKNYEYIKKYRRRDPRKRLAYMLKGLYALSIDAYETLLAEQKGLCAICQKPPGKTRLGVDHCHDTGKVRALLCTKCNTAIGQLQHDPDLAMKAALYLEKHK